MSLDAGECAKGEFNCILTIFCSPSLLHVTMDPPVNDGIFILSHPLVMLCYFTTGSLLSVVEKKVQSTPVHFTVFNVL